MLELLPYNRFSKSAKALAKALGVKRLVTPRGIAWAQRKGRPILVWGSKANNKLENLRKMQAAGVPTVEFTTDREVAKGWLGKGYKVVCRTLLRACGGKGARVADDEITLVRAPLYTKYFRKDQEFRVHVFQGEVIDYVKKRRRTGYENNMGHNDLIRVHANGWVYARNNVVLPDCVRTAALGAARAIGVSVGAVDVVYRVKDSKEKCAVLEVNTAPGLEGKTLQSYTSAIRRFYGI